MATSQEPTDPRTRQVRLGYDLLTRLLGTAVTADDRVHVTRTDTRVSVEVLNGKTWKPLPQGTAASLYAEDGKRVFNVVADAKGGLPVDQEIKGAVIAPLVFQLGGDVVTINRVDPPKPHGAGTKTTSKSGAATDESYANKK